MVSSIVIIVVSSVLFWYWFRYVCLLLLDTVSVRDHAIEVAAENNLSFPDVPNELVGAQPEELDEIAHALRRDYERVLFLLAQLEQLELGGVSIEHHLLRLDFLLMRAWYRLSRHHSLAKARDAIDDMRLVVAKLANGYGEQVVRLKPVKT